MKLVNMKEINEMIDHLVSDNVERARLKELIVDHVIDKQTEGFKAGWTKGGYVNNQVNQIINKTNKI
tara:strand:- start:17 stop:217 length:201 start_codon:yes stop_codon:yes gene_type:complete